MYIYIYKHVSGKEWLEKMPEALGFTFMSLMHTHIHIDTNKQLRKCIYTHIHIDILMYIHTSMYQARSGWKKCQQHQGLKTWRVVFVTSTLVFVCRYGLCV